MHVVGYLSFCARLGGEGTIHVRLRENTEEVDHACDCACPDSGKGPYVCLLDTGICTSRLLSGHMQVRSPLNNKNDPDI